MKASELFDVAGLAVIVTGAASGIGYAYADAMADNGARVVLVDIDRAGLDQAVAKLKARGGDVRGAVADVTDRGALRAAFDRAAGELGRLDVLFANAGIDSGPGFLGMTGERAADGAFETLAEERWDKVIATNLTSVFNSIRAAVPHMKKNGKTAGASSSPHRLRRCGPKPLSVRPTCRPKPAPRIWCAKPPSNSPSTTFWSTRSRRALSSPTSPAGTCAIPK